MTAVFSKQNTVSNPSEWDGLFRAFAKQREFNETIDDIPNKNLFSTFSDWTADKYKKKKL